MYLKEDSASFTDALHIVRNVYMALDKIMLKDNRDNERGNQLRQVMFFFLADISQDSIYNGFYYTSCGALAGTGNSSVSQPSGIDPSTYRTMSGRFTTETTPRCWCVKISLGFLSTHHTSKPPSACC